MDRREIATVTPRVATGLNWKQGWALNVCPACKRCIHGVDVKWVELSPFITEVYGNIVPSTHFSLKKTDVLKFGGVRVD